MKLPELLRDKDDIKASRELDALIAYFFFGWRWFERPAFKLCGFFPPDSENWARWNFHQDYVEIDEWPEESRRFADWFRRGSGVGGDGYLPLFSTNISAAFLVVDAVNAKGHEVIISSFLYLEKPWSCLVVNSLPTRRDIYYNTGTTVPECVCGAALKMAIDSHGKIPGETQS